jgi:hypothetical protein
MFCARYGDVVIWLFQAVTFSVSLIVRTVSRSPKNDCRGLNLICERLSRSALRGLRRGEARLACRVEPPPPLLALLDAELARVMVALAYSL